MQIPAKIQHGEKVIATVFDKINGIIDYLNASRIRKGPGILVDESPSGTVIKLADNRPATPPQVLPALGGGGVTGFPNFFSGSAIVVSDLQSYVLTEDKWLIGSIQSQSFSGDASFYLNISKTDSPGSTHSIKLLMIGDESPSVFRFVPVCIPLKSGLTISFSKDYIGTTCSLQLYPCL